MRPSRLLCLAFAAAGWSAAGRAEEKPVEYTGLLSLVRYEMPLGLSDGFAPTRQPAVRKGGEDAVDWPDCTLDGRPIFRAGAEERLPLKLHAGVEAASPFQLRTDDVVQPGNHWLRAMEWGGGRRHIYTADRDARTAASSETMSGRYELWTFPLRISGEGGPGVKNVHTALAAPPVAGQDAELDEWNAWLSELGTRQRPGRRR